MPGGPGILVNPCVFHGHDLAQQSGPLAQLGLQGFPAPGVFRGVFGRFSGSDPKVGRRFVLA